MNKRNNKNLLPKNYLMLLKKPLSEEIFKPKIIPITMKKSIKRFQNKKLNYNAYNQCPCCENDVTFFTKVSNKIGFDVAVCDKCNFNSILI